MYKLFIQDKTFCGIDGQLLYWHIVWLTLQGFSHVAEANHFVLLFFIRNDISICSIQAATKILARQLVRLRQQITNLQGSRAQIRGVATHTQVTILSFEMQLKDYDIMCHAIYWRLVSL